MIIKLVPIIDKRMKLIKLLPALIGFTTATEDSGKSILELQESNLVGCVTWLFQWIFPKHFVKMKLQLAIYQVIVSRAEKQKWREEDKDPTYIN